MEDRDFTEVDLRQMLWTASGFREDIIDGRWIIETRFRGESWEIIVEPEVQQRRLVVITAYQWSG